MKRAVALVTLAIAFSVSTPIWAVDRLEKVKTLMQAQGLLETFEQQLAMGKQHAQQQASQMLAQVLGGLNPPEPYKARFAEASNEFIGAMHSPWTAKEIVQS